METLLGKTLTELQNLVKDLGMPTFTAKQIFDWLYKKKVSSIDEMTNISQKHRSVIAGLTRNPLTVGRISPTQHQTSADGTIKYLFKTTGGHAIETVFIPDKDRATLCVSTQAGCKMNCLFCTTGKQGFNGQLTAGEILNQILSIPESDQLTNLVFMGMGEPLDNTDEVLNVLDILTSEVGFAWSPKRITVSSVGIIPGLKRLLDESKVHVAISLHSPFPAERLSLMPIEKACPMLDVLDLVSHYDFAHQRRLSFEYICFGGLNDTPKHSTALAQLLRNIPYARVNLINYHPATGVNLPASNPMAMVAFRDYLNGKGIISTIRASRGEDILAACGMLSAVGKHQDSKKD
ncbi:putative dual-specificity RNA methyltransferase RlmN [Bacteroidia bacterium]|nr:putative dual-specificity RNA methyltransferase RlmN [Bacteroidia bacterium]